MVLSLEKIITVERVKKLFCDRLQVPHYRFLNNSQLKIFLLDRSDAAGGVAIHSLSPCGFQIQIPEIFHTALFNKHKFLLREGDQRLELDAAVILLEATHSGTRIGFELDRNESSLAPQYFSFVAPILLASSLQKSSPPPIKTPGVFTVSYQGYSNSLLQMTYSDSDQIKSLKFSLEGLLLESCEKTNSWQVSEISGSATHNPTPLPVSEKSRPFTDLWIEVYTLLDEDFIPGLQSFCKNFKPHYKSTTPQAV